MQNIYPAKFKKELLDNGMLQEDMLPRDVDFSKYQFKEKLLDNEDAELQYPSNASLVAILQHINTFQEEIIRYNDEKEEKELVKDKVKGKFERLQFMIKNHFELLTQENEYENDAIALQYFINTILGEDYIQEKDDFITELIRTTKQSITSFVEPDSSQADEGACVRKTYGKRKSVYAVLAVTAFTVLSLLTSPSVDVLPGSPGSTHPSLRGGPVTTVAGLNLDEGSLAGVPSEELAELDLTRLNPPVPQAGTSESLDGVFEARVELDPTRFSGLEGKEPLELTDEQKEGYIFKTLTGVGDIDEYQGKLDISSEVARELGFETPEFEIIEIDGKKVMVTRKLKGVKDLESKVKGRMLEKLEATSDLQKKPVCTRFLAFLEKGFLENICQKIKGLHLNREHNDHFKGVTCKSNKMLPDNELNPFDGINRRKYQRYREMVEMKKRYENWTSDKRNKAETFCTAEDIFIYQNSMIDFYHMLKDDEGFKEENKKIASDKEHEKYSGFYLDHEAYFAESRLQIGKLDPMTRFKMAILEIATRDGDRNPGNFMMKGDVEGDLSKSSKVSVALDFDHSDPKRSSSESFQANSYGIYAHARFTREMVDTLRKVYDNLNVEHKRKKNNDLKESLERIRKIYNAIISQRVTTFNQLKFFAKDSFPDN